MMNEKLIIETVKLINNYFDAENITVSNQTIENQVKDWYNHSEIVETEMLAAAVINYGNYRPGTKWNELKQLREFYFPFNEENIIRTGHNGFYGFENEEKFREEILAMENFHISEIEAAQRDIIWQ